MHINKEETPLMLQRQPGKSAMLILSLLFILLAISGVGSASLAGGDPEARIRGGQVHHLPDISDEEAIATLDELEHRSSPSLQYIFGDDDRQQVLDTTQHPYNKVVYLEAWKEGFDFVYVCSGSFVSRDVIMTAAHCAWIPDFGGWPDGIAVVPGKNGETEPFGFEFADDVWVPEGWVQNEGKINQAADYDYALIRLPDTRLGDAVGNMTMGILQTDSLKSATFNPVTAGYPTDKEIGTQWTTSEGAFVAVGDSHLRTEMDVYPGQSGSPVWRASDEAIVGIMSFEVVAGSPGNYAIRLTSDILSDYLEACDLIGCSLSFFVETSQATPSVPPPAATITPPQPTLPPVAGDTGAFGRTWARTDKPVLDGAVNRTWMWGPREITGVFEEPYVNAPDGHRSVLYHEKSRMEINDPAADPNSIWYVTNGLIALEMITGRLQLGNALWEQYAPAGINIAGDPTDPDAPTYSTFSGLLNQPARTEGDQIIATVNRVGQITGDPSLADQNVTAAYYVTETHHTVASVFWDFMNAEGLVYEQGALNNAKLFENPFFATGLPISEAYWTMIEVGGIEQLVLVQAFERRVLTYTPGNAAGWEVEAGNVGMHYLNWRYQVLGQ